MLEEAEKLRRLREIGVPEGLFAGVSSKVLKAYRQRAVTEKPSELAAHPKEVRATLTAVLLWSRSREITDSLADLLIQVVHRIGARAERRVERELLEDPRRVNGKTNILFRVAEAAVGRPEGTVREVLFPAVGEETLRNLVKESRSAGPTFRLETSPATMQRGGGAGTGRNGARDAATVPCEDDGGSRRPEEASSSGGCRCSVGARRRR